MLFNSIEFALFLALVFVLYWFLLDKNLRYQNYFLLVASWGFYAWWDWKLLFLLIFISLLTYFTGNRIEQSRKTYFVRRWLMFGIVANLGTLALFKYFNFFIDSFIDLVSNFGYELPYSSTRIVLPVGISFYVFLSLSYIIDVFRQDLKADYKINEVLLSVGFFPIILAGPIQRPASLLPQISNRRVFDYNLAIDGSQTISLGLVCKNCDCR